MAHSAAIMPPPLPGVLPSLGPSQKSAEVPAEEMIQRLASFFSQYLHCDPDLLPVLCLWTLHTHCLKAANATPYLNICSTERQSGKTLCLELLGLVCAHPWYVTGITPAALTCKLATSQPTALLDECQTLFSVSDTMVRGLLVAGSRRGGLYEFMQKNMASPSVVEVFCPKAFAGMRILPPAIDSRCIPIPLHALRGPAHLKRFTPAQAREEAAPLVAWLNQWSSDNLPALRSLAPYSRSQMPPELNPRQQDLVEPLLQIAGLIGGSVPKDLHLALVKCFHRHSARGCFVQLLSDVRAAFDAVRTRSISSMSLLKFLNSIKSRPWSTWHDGDPMTPIDLARILRPHGISPKNIRDCGSVYKGYVVSDFRALWQHHLGSEQTKTEERQAATALQSAALFSSINKGRNR